MSAGLVLLSPLFSKMSVMLPKIVSGHVIHQKNPEVMPKKRDKFGSIIEENSIFLERLSDSRRSCCGPSQSGTQLLMAHKVQLTLKCLLGELKMPKDISK